MRGLPRHAELSRIRLRPHPVPVPQRVQVGVVLLLVAAAGCGPIEYISTVPFDAARALGEARQHDAARHAPYELTASEQYLHKARELAGYARFQSAIRFGDKAADNARKAQKLADERSRLPEERSDGPVNGEPSVTEVKTIEAGPATPSTRPAAAPRPPVVTPMPPTPPPSVVVPPAAGPPKPTPPAPRPPATPAPAPPAPAPTPSPAPSSPSGPK